MQEEFGRDVEVEWRSFLLRPEPGPRHTLEEFKKYTESWKRAAATEAGAIFRVWSTEEGPPSHSIPPHLVAKAATRVDPEAFERIHNRLFEAYFSENRDITATQVLKDLWGEVGLEIEAFEKTEDPELLREVFAQHNEAIEHGATGVPAVHMDGGFGVIVGAEPIETYRRWIARG